MARILLIDDDDDLRQALRNILRTSGHDVVEASNGEAALAHIADVDLAITDVLMPEADGIEFIRSVRERRPGLPVIAISGGNQRFPASVSLSLSEAFGANEVLYKPFARAELLAAIERSLPRPPATPPR